MTNILTPGEEAANSEIQRAQARDKKIKGLGKLGASAGLTAASVGIGLGSAKIADKILPLLSEYIPVDLAIKGISKLSPQLGSFLQKGAQKGLDLKEGLDFVKENLIQQQQPSEEKAKQEKNIIEQESPELFQFLDQEIRKGRKPIEAAAIAQNDKRFSSTIQKLMKTHKTPWSSIIESIFGSGEQALEQQSQPTPPQNQPTQPQEGAGQQALMGGLMTMVQNLQQARGGK